MRERTQIKTLVPAALRPGAALVAVLGLGLLAAGCGARSRTPLSERQPGTTTILVANHLGARDELDHLVVNVDSTLVPLAALPPRGEEAAALATLRLPPGPHTISVRATGHGRETGTAVVAAQQIFHVAAPATEIDIDLRSREEPSELDARLAIDLSMKGGHMPSEFGAGPSEGKDERCAPLQPIPRAICRAASELDEANKRNDLVSVLCIRDKLGAMRQLSLIGDTSDGDVAGLATKKVEDLSREVDRCVGDVTVGADGLTVTRPGAGPSPAIQPSPAGQVPGSHYAAPRSTARL